MIKILKDALVLAIITIVSGAILGGVYKITEGPIAEQNEKTKIKAYNSVFNELDTYENIDNLAVAQNAIEDAGYNAVILNEVVRAYDKDSNELGMIITVTDKDGYGGDIKMTIGIDCEGTITGLEILEINETAGLGMKAKDESFRKQYVGINADKIEYTKNGKTQPNEIDAISSATVTTSAVTDGVNGGIIAFKTLGGGTNE